MGSAKNSTVTGTKMAPKKRGNPNWEKGMQSPNPAGRPRGIVDRRMELTQQLSEEIPVY